MVVVRVAAMVVEAMVMLREEAMVAANALTPLLIFLI